MEKPRIRHIAVNVQDPEKTAEYYKKTLVSKSNSALRTVRSISQMALSISL